MRRQVPSEGIGGGNPNPFQVISSNPEPSRATSSADEEAHLCMRRLKRIEAI